MDNPHRIFASRHSPANAALPEEHYSSIFKHLSSEGAGDAAKPALTFAQLWEHTVCRAQTRREAARNLNIVI
ncbi:MAG: hypothetical protein LBC99_10950 [Spirochaetota bacterium]|nr:hypothetical protein [Spirochaetota bacterium]